MYLLNNGLKIPKVGFGTWKATDKEQCKNAVKTAHISKYTWLVKRYLI